MNDGSGIQLKLFRFEMCDFDGNVTCGLWTCGSYFHNSVYFSTINFSQVVQLFHSISEPFRRFKAMHCYSSNEMAFRTVTHGLENSMFQRPFVSMWPQTCVMLCGRTVIAMYFTIDLIR